MPVRDVIRAHMHDTLTLVYASSGEAARIQADLTERAFPVKRATPPAGRPTLAKGPKSLGAVGLPPSWLLIALIDTVADVDVLSRWAAGKDPSRIRLYFPPGADLHALLASWPRAGTPPPRAQHYRGLPGFRRDVGIAINDRIAQDFGPPGTRS